ncbi:MAG: hypothetical protein M0Q53_10825 [Prolixibacteraceae bacterium]|nr:hypothetical protein [Prolixibacteraceae bacterium]
MSPLRGWICVCPSLWSKIKDSPGLQVSRSFCLSVIPVISVISLFLPATSLKTLLTSAIGMTDPVTMGFNPWGRVRR